VPEFKPCALKVMFSLKSPFLPDPWLVAELIQRKRYARITRKEEAGMIHQWFLLCGQANKERLLDPQPGRLGKLLPPQDRTWADPFLWKRGADWFVFCEEWVFGKPHGHIAVIQLSPDGQRVSASEPVLVKDYHLSYPFLFDHEGALHMVPEGGHGGAIRVYECEEFPCRWREKATLMRNVDYVDATLLEHQGRWWLLATIKKGVYALNRDLFAFWADRPLADNWKPHPANPVVRGLTKARPAGRVFELGGGLFRPSQNCLVRYGYGLNINEILCLDTKRYQERLVTEVRPDWEPGIRGNHHMDWLDGMMAMDAQQLVPAQSISA
jgi:hypothetical protein